MSNTVLSVKPFTCHTIFLQPAIVHTISWGEAPISLDSAQLPEWPDNVFPEPFQDYVNALSAATETPLELASSIVLGMISTATQGKYRIDVKPNWKEYSNVWVVTALPASSLKSPVFGAAQGVITSWETTQKAKTMNKAKEIQSEINIINGNIKLIEKELAKEKRGEKATELLKEIEALKISKPELPRFPQLWTSDITPENLAIKMSRNNGFMSISSDEGGVFETTMGGRYNQGKANLDSILKSYSGTPIRIDRTSIDETISIDVPLTTMVLTVQPSVLSSNKNKQEFNDRGVFARYLFTIPEYDPGRLTFDGPPVKAWTEVKYINAMNLILNHKYADPKDKERKHLLKLNKDAYNALIEFAREVTIKTRSGGEFENIDTWAGKLRGQVVRIAALFHIARYADKKPWDEDIGVDDIRAAIRTGNAFSKHALKAFGVMNEASNIELARRILKWIKKDGVKKFTARDCQRKLSKRVDDINPALDTLVEYSHIKLKSGKIYEVNPIEPV